MTPINESVVEQAALAWLESLGYAILYGPEIAPGEASAERDHYGQVVLERRLRQALQQLNPQVPADALDEAFRKLTRLDSPSLVANNHLAHKYLVEGVPVEYQRADGSMAGDLERILDALEVNDSAVKVLGDETLRIIAQELVRTVRGNLKIDWTVRENVRAEMRVMIKRILRRYGYPPDKQARATNLVLEQAEVLCQEWSLS